MSRGWIQRVQEAAGIIRYLANVKGNTVHHRTDGPAKINGGTEVWMVCGEVHRLDGPAAIYPDGDEIWFMNGQMHREDGPAMVHADGTKCYYLFNRQYSYKEWLKALGRTP